MNNYGLYTGHKAAITDKYFPLQNVNCFLTLILTDFPNPHSFSEMLPNLPLRPSKWEHPPCCPSSMNWFTSLYWITEDPRSYPFNWASFFFNFKNFLLCACKVKQTFARSASSWIAIFELGSSEPAKPKKKSKHSDTLGLRECYRHSDKEMAAFPEVAKNTCKYSKIHFPEKLFRTQPVFWRLLRPYLMVVGSRLILILLVSKKGK